MYKDISLFDAHFHIIDDQFSLVENNGYLPEKYTCDDYLSRLEGINLIGGAVVSGSFHGYDQNYMKATLNKLGPSYVGVTQLPTTVSDKEIIDLNIIGIRAIRFNLERCAGIKINNLVELAHRVFDVAGWHIELYVDSSKLPDLFHVLIKLPAVCIDHLGMSKAGYGTLLNLVENNVYVKATGFGRVEFDVAKVLKELYTINPKCLIFGTDLPSTRAPRSFHEDDMHLMYTIFNREDAENILYKMLLHFIKYNNVTK